MKDLVRMTVRSLINLSFQYIMDIVPEVMKTISIKISVQVYNYRIMLVHYNFVGNQFYENKYLNIHIFSVA